MILTELDQVIQKSHFFASAQFDVHIAVDTDLFSQTDVDTDIDPRPTKVA
eukprot:NODE_29359_length_200_cov_2.271523_g28189_i0.p3 GENE.NODE_29359_length_200_cov_2.271523_g28189_i0~~NODE_29359_length_200_cov_2.271523_g28189_i0.p3  ORF type:complete len:50 (+),score=7.07 NODE_29359_length_200_cov_2.271523_g28189_i0:48-197(+)